MKQDINMLQVVRLVIVNMIVPTNRTGPKISYVAFVAMQAILLVTAPIVNVVKIGATAILIVKGLHLRVVGIGR